ncbi:MAG: PucR family transcriptional regulator, partial [Xanthomonas perforans]|nr:PucR family transcriptional regulator [Xanthomonas perforans]
MAQFSVRDLLTERERLGLELAAGPPSGTDIVAVDIATLDALDALEAGTLAIIPGEENPAPYRLDVALRQASARGLAGLVFTTDLALAETAVALAERGRVPVLAAPQAKPSDLAVAIDRLLSGGASEAMTRAAYAIDQAAAAAGADGSVDGILAAAGRALGVGLSLEDDPTVLWSDNDAVCVGEVPIGRLVADRSDAAADVARPVVASLISRATQRQLRDRYAPTQSRADLLVELVLAESSRVEAFVGQAARLGFPLQLSHVVGWLKPTAIGDPDARPPRGVEPALELFALQIVEGREEMWHVAFIQEDMFLVSTEEHGAGDHQRRLREVGERLQRQAQRLAGSGWAYTL